MELANNPQLHKLHAYKTPTNTNTPVPQLWNAPGVNFVADELIGPHITFDIWHRIVFGPIYSQ